METTLFSNPSNNKEAFESSSVRSGRYTEQPQRKCCACSPCCCTTCCKIIWGFVVIILIILIAVGIVGYITYKNLVIPTVTFTSITFSAFQQIASIAANPLIIDKYGALVKDLYFTELNVTLAISNGNKQIAATLLPVQLDVQYASNHSHFSYINVPKTVVPVTSNITLSLIGDSAGVSMPLFIPQFLADGVSGVAVFYVVGTPTAIATLYGISIPIPTLALSCTIPLGIHTVPPTCPAPGRQVTCDVKLA